MEKAFVLVKFESLTSGENEEQLARKISEISGVDTVYDIAWPMWDLLVQITVDHVSKIGQIVMRQIRPMSGVEETRTILVLETFTKGD